MTETEYIPTEKDKLDWMNNKIKRSTFSNGEPIRFIKRRNYKPIYGTIIKKEYSIGVLNIDNWYKAATDNFHWYSVLLSNGSIEFVGNNDMERVSDYIEMIDNLKTNNSLKGRDFIEEENALSILKESAKEAKQYLLLHDNSAVKGLSFNIKLIFAKTFSRIKNKL